MQGSFSFAWVLDQQEAERARGVTIDVAIQSFETESRMVSPMSTHCCIVMSLTCEVPVCNQLYDSKPVCLILVSQKLDLLQCCMCCHSINTLSLYVCVIGL